MGFVSGSRRVGLLKGLPGAEDCLQGPGNFGTDGRNSCGCSGLGWGLPQPWCPQPVGRWILVLAGRQGGSLGWAPAAFGNKRIFRLWQLVRGGYQFTAITCSLWVTWKGAKAEDLGEDFYVFVCL